MARGLGVELSREAAATIRDRIKAEAYASGSARVDLERVLSRAPAEAQLTRRDQKAQLDEQVHLDELSLSAHQGELPPKARQVLQPQPGERPKVARSRQARA